jgi:hypothetical protein
MISTALASRSALALAAALALGCATSTPIDPFGGESGSGKDPGAGGSSRGSGGDSGSGSGGDGSGAGTGPWVSAAATTGATSGSGGSTGAATTAASTSAATTGATSTSAASGATSGSGSTGAGGAGTCTGGAPPADPKCYWEPVCPDAPIDDLAQSFSPADWMATAMAMTQRRYPSAACLINEYANDVGNYADNSSFEALSESLMTMVHEETHGFDYDHANWGSSFAYYVGCNNSLTANWIEGFPRSEIAAQVEGNATSLYDGTYLTGTQGTYGWLEVLDEWNAYLNGMAGIGLFGDYVTGGISGTDGALALAYYAELYLRVARTQHPSVYAQIKGDAGMVDLLRRQWNRMHFFLALADKYPQLSIEASAIKAELYAAKNQSELEMVIGLPLTPTACN